MQWREKTSPMKGEIQVMIWELKDHGIIWEITNEEKWHLQAVLVSIMRRKGLKAKEIRDKIGIPERTQSRRLKQLRPELEEAWASERSRSAKTPQKS
jgi:hypothetical protein